MVQQSAIRIWRKCTYSIYRVLEKPRALSQLVCRFPDNRQRIILYQTKWAEDLDSVFRALLQLGEEAHFGLCHFGVLCVEVGNPLVF